MIPQLLTHCHTRPNKTDAGNGSKAICRVINVLRSPSPDPRRPAYNELNYTPHTWNHYRCARNYVGMGHGDSAD
jgi:hypothetical protein